MPKGIYERKEVKKRGNPSVWIEGDVAHIYLSSGHIASVSIEHLDKVLEITWSASKSKKTYYAVGYEGSGHSTRKRISLHCLIMRIMGLTLQADHIDKNGLNCTKENLRPATYSQNNAYRGTPKNNTVGFKGVYLSGNRSSFCACLAGKHLGTYATAEGAARAYDKAAFMKYREFAHVNFPLDIGV